MKIRFRIIAVNIIVSMAVLAFICQAVVINIYSYSYEFVTTELSQYGYEANSYINDDISSLLTVQSPETALSSTASQLANDVSGINKLRTIIYDRSGNFLATSNIDFFEGDFSQFAKDSVDQDKQGAVYTKINGISNILLFTPLKIEASSAPYGVVTQFLEMRQPDQTVNQVVFLFVVLSVVMSVVTIFFYNFIYDRMFLPIRQSSDYLAVLAENGGSEGAFSMQYNGKDEISSLIENLMRTEETLNTYKEVAKRQKANVKDVISAISDAVVCVNLAGEPMIENEVFSEYFPNDTDFFIVVGKIDECVKKAQANKTQSSAEFEYEQRNFLVTASPVLGAYNNQAAIAVIKDVTTIKRMEQNQQKFISSVSHELRTPLTAIKGYIDLLERRGTDDPELTQKALTTTRSEIARLMRMVDELLNINAYSSAEFDLIFTNIDPDELISEAVIQMNVKAEENGIYIQYNRIKLPEVRGDRDRLKQVLINIIDNAVKYSDPGNAVRVIASYDEEYLEITVRDYGVGIPENKQDKVFDTFYRVEEDRNRQRGGVGLGLSIVRNIIVRHSGTVSIESLPDQGTLVIIRLPMIVTPSEKIDGEEAVNAI